MSVKIQVITAVFILISLSVIVNMIRKKSLELKYALTWLIVGFGLLVLDLFPGLMEWLSRTIGVATPANMLFFFGFCFSLAIIFVLTITVSRLSVRIRVLAQELALFKKEMTNRTKDNL